MAQEDVVHSAQAQRRIIEMDSCEWGVTQNPNRARKEAAEAFPI